eukprot:833569-Alexandrium_andersonii.AAC.1
MHGWAGTTDEQRDATSPAVPAAPEIQQHVQGPGVFRVPRGRVAEADAHLLKHGAHTEFANVQDTHDAA